MNIIHTIVNELMHPVYQTNNVMDQDMHRSFSFIRDIMKNSGVKNTLWNQVVGKETVQFQLNSQNTKKHSFSQVVDFMMSIESSIQDVSLSTNVVGGDEDINRDMRAMIVTPQAYLNADNDMDVEFYMEKYFDDVSKRMQSIMLDAKNMHKFTSVVWNFVNGCSRICRYNNIEMVIGDERLFNCLYLFCAYFVFHMWHELQVKVVASICDGYTWSLTIDLTEEEKSRFEKYWISIVRNCLNSVVRGLENTSGLENVIVINRSVADTILTNASCDQKSYFSMLPIEVIHKILVYAFQKERFPKLGCRSMNLLQYGDEISISDILTVLMGEFRDSGF